MFHCLLNFETSTLQFPYWQHSRLPRLCIILVKSWYLTRTGCILLPYYPITLLGLAINSNIHCSRHKHLVEERLCFCKGFWKFNSHFYKHFYFKLQNGFLEMSLVIYINKLLAAPQSRHAISQPSFLFVLFWGMPYNLCHVSHIRGDNMCQIGIQWSLDLDNPWIPKMILSGIRTL